jgi:hypothetical protein
LIELSNFFEDKPMNILFPTTFQLFNWALEPAEDYVLDQLFEVGYKDAAVWAEKNPVEVVEDGNPLVGNGFASSS